MRSGPGAKWIAFTAEEEIDATRSRFRWEAQYRGGRMGWMSVTDAFDDGRGWLAIKLAGVIPVKKMTGPELDQGELQRYLASVVLCPAMLLNHQSLSCTPVGVSTLNLSDRGLPIPTTVDLEVGEDGVPGICSAIRYRLVGRQPVSTPWSARGGEFREWEGMRVASRLEVSWHPAEGAFTYYRCEISGFQVLR